MSPTESTNNSNRSRIKNLSDKLLGKDKKFERVRIVCTKPYGKPPFGLSMVNINNALGDQKSSDEKEEPTKVYFQFNFI
jgi:hypothetical protein